MSPSEPSDIADSTTCPRPLRCRSCSAASTPIASIIAPPPKSPTRLSGTGGGVPVGAHRVERAGDRDVVEVVAALLGERSRRPPAGHAAVDERRVAGQALVGTDAEPLGHPGPVPLDQDVGALDQAEERLAALLPGGGRGSATRGRGRSRGRGAIRDVDAPTGSTRMMRAPMSANNIASSGSGPMPPSSTTVTPASGPPPGVPSSAVTAPPPVSAPPVSRVPFRYGQVAVDVWEAR